VLLRTLKRFYTPIADRAAALQRNAAAGGRRGGAAVQQTGPEGAGSLSFEAQELLEELTVALDKKHLAQVFFEVRKWQLLPRWFHAARRVSNTHTPRETPQRGLRSAPTLHTRWDDAPPLAFPQSERDWRENPTVVVPDCGALDEKMEEVRRQGYAQALVAFNQECELFLRVHPTSTFVAWMRDFLSPEPHDASTH
jgi:hypothetical protein